MPQQSEIDRQLAQLEAACFSPLDLLPYEERVEKLLALVLKGLPAAPAPVAAGLAELAAALDQASCAEARVLVFGGGTGLANIIGGDSRNPSWPDAPFAGLKSVFPQTSAVVCVTDDGGSTGELLKDLPLLAVGDLRHVLLAAVRQDKLQKQYELDEAEALATVRLLHRLFNYRFERLPENSPAILEQCGVDLSRLAPFLERSLQGLLEEIFHHEQLQDLGQRPHCLGNLLLTAAIYQQPAMDGAADPRRPPAAAVLAGLAFLADLLGASPEAVLPCTTTPASLKMLYDNGVLVSGESKSARARRRCPVDRVMVEFVDQPEVPARILTAIAEADIIIFAPGSLFTSIIPILQVPGLAAAVRSNSRALKLLLANLWVQAGETDLVTGERERRFHVSDLLQAYNRNIPGGIAGLFHQVLVVGMREIPGSILQSYALENKVPIYLDRERVRELGPAPLEAAIAAQYKLDGKQVVQHDPAAVAAAVRALWAMRSLLTTAGPAVPASVTGIAAPLLNPRRQTLDDRRRQFRQRLAQMDLQAEWLPLLEEIFWHHRDILLEHLDQVAGMRQVAVSDWRRCQEWDNVFSFYDPDDRMIRIRADIIPGSPRCEIAFLVALGQSLLGNYAAAKEKSPVMAGREQVGYIFSLTMRNDGERRCFFTAPELVEYLRLARMYRAEDDPLRFTRVVNGSEGFTPPGLLFGLSYAWYLDNRFAPHIEYKMSITRAEQSDLVPEQLRISSRRQGLIDFFRERVFRCQV